MGNGLGYEFDYHKPYGQAKRLALQTMLGERIKNFVISLSLFVERFDCGGGQRNERQSANAHQRHDDRTESAKSANFTITSWRQ